MSSKHLALGVSCVQSQHEEHNALLWRFVQVGERLAAALLLALTSPLLLAAALILTVSSRRSPLIAHRRLGRSGELLWVLKLRTMWCDETPRAWCFVERIVRDPPLELIKTASDPRVTSRFAALCRRYSLDEIPQLWQVVRGDMALIGPRPLTAAEIKAYYGSEAFELLSRKPGITGLWQTRGRSSLSYMRRRRFDLFLHRRWSFRLYVRIALATVPAILTGKNAW